MHRSHASTFGRHLAHWSEVYFLFNFRLIVKARTVWAKYRDGDELKWSGQWLNNIFSVRFEKVNQDTTTMQHLTLHDNEMSVSESVHNYTSDLTFSSLQMKIFCKQINLQTAYSSTFGFDSRASNHLYNAIKKMHGSAHLDVIWLVQVCLFPGFNQSRSYLKLYYWKKRLLGLKQFLWVRRKS